MSESSHALRHPRGPRERGALRKDWGGKLSVALTYPNRYAVGMSNLGFQVLYGLLNKKGDVVAERVFLPDSKENLLREEGRKGLLSLESHSALQRFDVIAFSLPFENDFPNVLRILELGKIPLLSEDRGPSDPLVMGGGVTTFLNPEPLSAFFDFFLLGEAEPVLDGFLETLARALERARDRRELLRYLATRVRSLYVPSFYSVTYNRDGTIRSRRAIEPDVPEKIEAACERDPRAPVARTQVLTPDTAFADRVLVELGRGCGRSCRFCAAGYVYRPPRTHGEEKLQAVIDDVLKEHKKLGLLSAAVSDTPGIESLTARILDGGGTFSVSSVRAESLTPELLVNLKRAGQKTLSIAPEAGTERLRRVINKHLSRQQIIDAVRMVARIQDFALRLYFMVGLPTETREDVEAVLDLVKAIKHNVVRESSTRGRIREIHISVNCFIPKAFTPFQWFAMDAPSSLRDKQKWLRKAVGREGGVRISFDVPKWAYVQSLLSMGDRRVGSLLLRVHEQKGDWQKVFRTSDLNPDFFVLRPRGLEENLPWDFIDNGLRKEHLIREYHLALEARESEVCRVGTCVRCGVCSGEGR